MEHYTTPDFWVCYHHLPKEIQTLADKNYALLRSDPRHPSLQFKKVGEVWSVRVGQHYRCLAVLRDEGYVWFWIGTHAEYNRILGK